MPAYVIATMTIHDPATYRKYTDRTPATVKRYGGRFLTRGQDVATLEGEAFHERMVILEFPDKQHVEDWLADPEYIEARRFRHAASTSRLIMQEGAATTEAPDPKL